MVDYYRFIKYNLLKVLFQGDEGGNIMSASRKGQQRSNRVLCGMFFAVARERNIRVSTSEFAEFSGVAESVILALEAGRLDVDTLPYKEAVKTLIVRSYARSGYGEQVISSILLGACGQAIDDNLLRLVINIVDN